MYIQPLTEKNIGYFIRYCATYGKEHDESYLPNENFQVDSQEPGYLLYDHDNELIGIASLMLDKRRFRILHSNKPDYSNYKCLVDNIMTDIRGLENMFLFLPEDKSYVRTILEELDFDLQRYTWYLERDDTIVDDIEFPKDIEIKELDLDNEASIWCDIINNNFKDHQGISPLEVKDFVKEMNAQDNSNTEMLIIWKDKKPIGTIQIEMIIEDGIKMGYISWLSINDEYRGMGYGRALLKHAIKLASINRAEKACLVVHSTNDKALQLYRSEGFKKIESLVCYNKKLG